MRGLSENMHAAKLRRFTSLAAVQRKEIRCSSTYGMLSHLHALGPCLVNTDEEDVRILLPTQDERTDIHLLLKRKWRIGV